MTAGASEPSPDCPTSYPLIAGEILKSYGWFLDNRIHGVRWYLQDGSPQACELDARLHRMSNWDSRYGRTLEEAWELTFGEYPLAF